ncbi:hypothetical protein L484_000231 [Morus notabilis]|uniref:Uncharacterized protein n=2 Tax=Morus notabilis TaxID=981085 RepID=W9SFU8_9ROSA|nr:hypothetical protein L484_000231 [Morus notabilis]
MASSSTLLLSIPSSSVPHRSNHHKPLAIRLPTSLSFVTTPKFPNSTSFKPKPSLSSPNPRLSFSKLLAGSSLGNAEDPPLVGEDSATFDLAKQKISSWIYFTGILGAVLFVLDVAWLDNSTGYGKAFVDAVSGISDSHEFYLPIAEICNSASTRYQPKT